MIPSITFVLFLLLPFVQLNSVTQRPTANQTTKSELQVLNKMSNGLNIEKVTATKSNQNDELYNEKKCKAPRVEYVPVTLEHPLFKVFGINPRDYVVYYRYRYDASDELDEPLPVHKLDKIAAKYQELTTQSQLYKNSVNFQSFINNISDESKIFRAENEVRKRRKVERNDEAAMNEFANSNQKISSYMVSIKFWIFFFRYSLTQ